MGKLYFVNKKQTVSKEHTANACRHKKSRLAGGLQRREQISLALECVGFRLLDKLAVDGAVQPFGKAHRRNKAGFGCPR